MVHRLNCMNCKHFWRTGRNTLLVECPICGNGVMNKVDQLRNYHKNIIFKHLKNAKLTIMDD